MSNIIGYTNDDSDLYYGPNEDSGSFDHIPAGERIYVIGEEEGWYCIECPIGSLSSMNTQVAYGYVPMSVVDIISDPGDDDDGNGEDIGSTSTPHTGYEVAGYYGPDSSAYDVCTTLPESQIVTVLWEEGDYYYVEFVHDMEGVQMRAYVAKDSIEAFDGVPATYTESYTAVELLHNTMGYTGPGAQYATSGEVTTDWAISKLEGTQENGYVLIEHPGDGNRYKRVWIDASAVDEYNVPTPPTPPTTQDAAITNDDADLYYGPGTSYEYCDHIVAGEAVQVLWREGDWYYVECPAFSLSSENTRKVCAYIPVSVLVNVSENVENCSAALEEKALISDAPIYGGAGYAYLETDYIDRERTIYSVGGIEQNSFAFVEFCNDYGIFERGWVHTSLIDGDSNEDIDPDEPDGEGGGEDTPNPPTPDDTENSDLIAYTNPEVFCYYGPGATGNYDYGDFFEESQEVKICWEEGDYYCIDFETTVYENGVYNHNAKKRMYILKDDVTYSGNAVPSPDMTVSDESIHLTEAIWSYVGPGEDFVKEEQLWSYTTIYRVGDVIENGFVLIEFQSSESSYKRIWINASDIGITVRPDEPDTPENPDTPSVDTNVTITAVTNTNAVVYHGPDVTMFSDIDSIKNGETVSVLWKERDCYYVDCPASAMHNATKKMCGYVRCSDLSNLSSAPVDLGEASCNTIELVSTAPGFMGPGIGYNDAGTVDYNTTVKNVGNIVRNGFIFVENENLNIGITKRAWVPVNSRAISSIGSDGTSTEGSNANRVNGFTYFGPDETSYEYCDYLGDYKNMKFLWREGEYYYVECIVTVYKDGGYKDGKKRFYIKASGLPDVDLRSDITDNTEISFAPGTMGYTGPGEDYEEAGYIPEDTYVTRVNVDVENGFVFVKCQRNGELLKRVWVPLAKGRVTAVKDIYYGPNTPNKKNFNTIYEEIVKEEVKKKIIRFCNQYYKRDRTCALDEEDEVDILWEEGEYYYVRYYSPSIKKNKCVYYPKDSIEILSGAIVPFTPPTGLDTVDCYRKVTQATHAYYGPDGDEDGDGERDADVIEKKLRQFEIVKYLGITINEMMFVEYNINDNSQGTGDIDDTIKEDLGCISEADASQEGTRLPHILRRRAWVEESKLRDMPELSGDINIISNTPQYEKSSKMDANAEIIYKYLKCFGFSKQSACAILGNIQNECDFDPFKAQKLKVGDNLITGDIRYGYGIMQWTPATKLLLNFVCDGILSEPAESSDYMIFQSLRSEMNNMAEESVTYRNLLLEAQIAWMINQMFSYEWDASVIAAEEFIKGTNYAETKEAAGTLAIAFHRGLLRSGDDAILQNERRQDAEEWFTKSFVVNS